MKDVESRLLDVVASALVVSRSEVRPDSNLAEDLAADSLDMIELAMAIEDEFGIIVLDGDEQPWKTVGDVQAYILARKE